LAGKGGKRKSKWKTTTFTKRVEIYGKREPVIAWKPSASIGGWSKRCKDAVCEKIAQVPDSRSAKHREKETPSIKLRRGGGGKWEGLEAVFRGWKTESQGPAGHRDGREVALKKGGGAW